MKQDIDTALARLTEAFPQTFVLEKYQPHRPLKVGIAVEIPARCPAVERRGLWRRQPTGAQRDPTRLRPGMPRPWRA